MFDGRIGNYINLDIDTVQCFSVSSICLFDIMYIRMFDGSTLINFMFREYSTNPLTLNRVGLFINKRCLLRTQS